LDRVLFDQLRAERGVTWGRPLRLFESTSSTNDRALEALAEGMKTGGVFVAREQTQGRGRQGAAWQSEPGENLTFSVVLRLPAAQWALPSYTLIVGLALADALETRLPATLSWGIKWPNDIYVNGKKLAGILVEGRPKAGEFPLAIGIGLNVNTLDFGPESQRRTSLRLAIRESAGPASPEPASTGPASPGPASTRPEAKAHEATVPDEVDLRKEALLVDTLQALENRTRALVQGGFERCLPDLLKHDLLHGALLRTGGGIAHGAGIAPDGALLVKPLGSETLVRVQSGSIEFPLDPQLAVHDSS